MKSRTHRSQDKALEDLPIRDAKAVKGGDTKPATTTTSKVFEVKNFSFSVQ